MADGQKPKEATEAPLKKDDRYVPDDSDSTKSRRLAEDYDSTKNGMDYGKDQGTHILRSLLPASDAAAVRTSASSLFDCDYLSLIRNMNTEKCPTFVAALALETSSSSLPAQRVESESIS